MGRLKIISDGIGKENVDILIGEKSILKKNPDIIVSKISVSMDTSEDCINTATITFTDVDAEFVHGLTDFSKLNIKTGD
jgi:hypothetical protein